MDDEGLVDRLLQLPQDSLDGWRKPCWWVMTKANCRCDVLVAAVVPDDDDAVTRTADRRTVVNDNDAHIISMVVAVVVENRVVRLY